MRYIDIELPKELSKRKKLILFKAFFCKKASSSVENLLDDSITFNQDYDNYNLLTHNASITALNEYIKKEKLRSKYKSDEELAKYIMDTCEYVEFKLVLKDDCIYQDTVVKLPHIEEKPDSYNSKTNEIYYTIRDRVESINVHFDDIDELELHYDPVTDQYELDKLKLISKNSGITF